MYLLVFASPSGIEVSLAGKPVYITAYTDARVASCASDASRQVISDWAVTGLLQSAVEDVSRVYPAGVDYLVLTAGILDAGHSPTAIAT